MVITNLSSPVRSSFRNYDVMLTSTTLFVPSALQFIQAPQLSAVLQARDIHERPRFLDCSYEYDITKDLQSEAISTNQRL